MVKSTMTETCSAVLRPRRNCSSDGAERTEDGRAFHARAAVTGKARSPSVVRRVVGSSSSNTHTHTHAHTRLTALCLGLSRSAGTRKVKPIRILLKHETVSGSGISWTTCKSAAHSRQMTTPAPHHSVFYRPDALLAAQTTVSMH